MKPAVSVSLALLHLLQSIHVVGSHVQETPECKGQGLDLLLGRGWRRSRYFQELGQSSQFIALRRMHPNRSEFHHVE